MSNETSWNSPASRKRLHHVATAQSSRRAESIQKRSRVEESQADDPQQQDLLTLDLMCGTKGCEAMPFGLANSLRSFYEEDPVLQLTKLIESLADFPDDELVHSLCMGAFCEVVPQLLEKENRVKAICALITVMQAKSFSLVVQYEATKILHLLMTSPLEESLAVAVIERTTTALLAFPSDISLSCIGLDLLRKLKEFMLHPTLKNKVVRAVVGSQTMHTTVIFLQQLALCLISYFVQDPDCRATAANMSGLENILQSMEAHPSDSMVQCNATASVCWMIHGSAPGEGSFADLGAEPARLSSRLEERACEVATVAFKEHFHEATVFGNCLCLFCGLPTVPDEEQLFGLIQRGMKIHKYSARVQEAALRWIRLRDPHVYTNELKAFVPLILQAMEQHPESRNVQAQACEVLVMLLNVDETKTAVREHASVDAVLRSLAIHKDDDHIQHVAIWFLTLLLPLNEQSADQRPATAAFGGGFFALETVWNGLGINSNGPLV